MKTRGRPSVRELAEELILAADFIQPEPLFITVTRVDGGGGAYRRVALVFAARRQLARD